MRSGETGLPFRARKPILIPTRLDFRPHFFSSLPRKCRVNVASSRNNRFSSRATLKSRTTSSLSPQNNHIYLFLSRALFPQSRTWIQHHVFTFLFFSIPRYWQPREDWRQASPTQLEQVIEINTKSLISHSDENNKKRHKRRRLEQFFRSKPRSASARA